MLKCLLANVRRTHPLIHCITNYVTVNDCANILLACGASPIMADEAQEVYDITGICSGLTINLGTLHSQTVPSMHIAGKRANELGHPVILDPVGVGASRFRMEAALELLKDIHFAVIRCNMSEIKALANHGGSARGVDADFEDRVTQENLPQALAFVKAQARRLGCVLAVTGAIDLVTDGVAAYCVRNGCPMMASVTGAGCMLSALTAAYVTANPETPLEAAAAAVCAMGLSGEIASRRLGPLDGNASYRNYLIDAVCRMTPEELEKGAVYEVR